MNYQVITDPDKLKEFINWLPELEHDETFYLCLFARSKYCNGIAHLRSDKAQLKRFTSNKERLFNKIWQLECPIGAYTTKETNGGQIPVPQESLALYITINPRSFIRATRDGLKKLVDLISVPYAGYHPYQEVMSAVQKAKSKSKFITFDYDIENKQAFRDGGFPYHLYSSINEEALSVVETRGGFHLIVDLSKIQKQYEKSWYNDITRDLAFHSSDKDNKGDIMLPVPGTYQGGFTPKFI